MGGRVNTAYEGEVQLPDNNYWAEMGRLLKGRNENDWQLKFIDPKLAGPLRRIG